PLHAALPICRAVLSERESVSLRARVIGAERVRAEPAAAAEIAGLCGHLPLALRIAAAHLSGAHTDLASYAAELRESPRITKLAVSGDEISTGVEMAFQHSYVRLSAADRRLFRFIGLAPGADFTTEDAARLADLPPDQTAAGLAELCQAHLLEHRGHRRYRLHDLIRSYANQCGETEDAPPERDAALLRLVTAYLDSAAAAARLLHPQWLALLPRHVGTDPHRFTGRAAALAWLEAERANLVAAVRAAAPRAWPQVSDLAYAVRGFLAQRRHIDDLIEVSRAAVAASTAAGDGRGEASAQMNLAIAYGSLGDFDAARRRFAAVLATARRHHWTDIQTVAHHNLGFLYNQVGQLDQAAEQYRSALALDGGSGQALRGSSLTNLADVCYRRGQVDEAVRLLTQALEFAGQTAALGVAATAHTQLGQLYHLRAEPELARRHLTVGLARFRQVGNRSGEAEALHLLAAVRLESGDPAGARELAETALDIARDREDGPAEIGVHLILGELYLRGEQAGRAATEYAAARALAEDRGQRYGAVEALIGAARAA